MMDKCDWCGGYGSLCIGDNGDGEPHPIGKYGEACSGGMRTRCPQCTPRPPEHGHRDGIGAMAADYERLCIEKDTQIVVLTAERDEARGKANEAAVGFVANVASRLERAERERDALRAVVEAARAHDRTIAWDASDHEGEEWELHEAIVALDAGKWRVE